MVREPLRPKRQTVGHDKWRARARFVIEETSTEASRLFICAEQSCGRSGEPSAEGSGRELPGRRTLQLHAINKWKGRVRPSLERGFYSFQRVARRVCMLGLSPVAGVRRFAPLEALRSTRQFSSYCDVGWS